MQQFVAASLYHCKKTKLLNQKVIIACSELYLFLPHRVTRREIRYDEEGKERDTMKKILPTFRRIGNGTYCSKVMRTKNRHFVWLFHLIVEVAKRPFHSAIQLSAATAT